ncbi:unnamed protein product, partial [marine sediment metagenome]
AIQRAGIDLQNGKEVAKICNSLDIKFIHEGDSTRIYLAQEDVTDKNDLGPGGYCRKYSWQINGEI